MTDFFTLVLEKHSNIKIKKNYRDFYQMNKLVYYKADEEKTIIHAKNIQEIDIQSAYVTICRIMFENDKKFISKLDELMSNKLERNKFIAISLKGTPELQKIAYICKMIVSSIVMEVNSDPIIFELKKDSVSFLGDNSIENSKLYHFYQDNYNFKFHLKTYKQYVRYNKTSYFLDDNDELILKGQYKIRPQNLLNSAGEILRGNEIDLENLNKIYSKKYLNILKQNNLTRTFQQYYVNDNKYLNNIFKYSHYIDLQDINNLFPKNYLKLFIYPLLVIK